MAYGPLVSVKTQTAAVRLDVRRALNYEPGVTLAFVRPDASEPSKWATLKEYTNGFSRLGPDESDRRDGHTVIFRVANLALTDELPEILRVKDVHIKFQGQYFKVNTVPKVPPDVAQVYDLICAERTLRTQFDNAR